MKQFTLSKMLRALFVMLAVCCLWQKGRAQSFTQTSPFDTIVMNNDTLHWYFIAPAPNAYGNATITVFFEGDFGSTSEYIDVYGENWSLLGSTGNSPSNTDCNVGLDSAFFTIPAFLVNTWGAAGDTIKIYGITSPNVDYFCTTNHARARLSYSYCTSPNAQPASFSMAVTTFCPNDGSVTLSATPAGGTFSGPGVTGTTFDPEMLTGGTYYITYTVTDTTGCTSSASDTVMIQSAPVITGAPPAVCVGGTASLTATGADFFIWYSDAALTNALDTTTTNAFNTPAINQNTTYYVNGYDSGYVFTLSSLNEMDSMAVDHDLLSGDDRGGIAVTNNYVYIVGDNNTVRFDLDFAAAGTSLPVNDGIFSNLANGKLYTLYDGNSVPQYPSTYNFTQIVELDSALNLTSNVLTLSQPIMMGSNNQYSGIFAGYNLLIVYSGDNMHWYAVDLTDGDVEDLGSLNNPEFYGSENWAVWGIAEFDGTNYSVVFNHSNWSEIHRRVLPAQPSTLVHAFSNLSDMSSITYAPWNNRWYFHHEGSSQFGTFSEAAGYASASHNTPSIVTSSAFACVREVELEVTPVVTITPVSNAVYCESDAAFGLTATPAGGTFSGPGVSGSVFDPSVAGVGTHNIVYTFTDTNMCSNSDTIAITVDACTSVEELTAASVSVQPNPNNGVFTLNVSLAAATEMNIEVFTIEGKVVYAERVNANAGRFTTSLDITNLSSGIYYLRVMTGNGQGMVKLVKQN